MLILSQDRQHIINMDYIAEFYISESIIDQTVYCLTVLMADMSTVRIVGEYSSEKKCLSVLQSIMGQKEDYYIPADTDVTTRNESVPEGNEEKQENIWAQKIDEVVEKIRGPYMDAYNEGRWRLRFIPIADTKELSESTCDLLRMRNCFSVEDVFNLNEKQLEDIQSISTDAFHEVCVLMGTLQNDLSGWLKDYKENRK